MEFELQYELDEFREIQDQYFDEDGKAWNRHCLSENIAEKMLSLINNLSERVNELEPVIKQQIKKSLPIHDVTQCLPEDSREFKEWQRNMGITRQENTNIYNWNEFKYERAFFLEKFMEDRNRANCG